MLRAPRPVRLCLMTITVTQLPFAIFSLVTADVASFAAWDER